MPPETFPDLKISPKYVAADAPPQTPLGSSTLAGLWGGEEKGMERREVSGEQGNEGKGEKGSGRKGRVGKKNPKLKV